MEIFQRPFDIVDADARRAVFHDPAREPLLEGVEPDDEVRNSLFLARRSYTDGDYPGQELIVSSNVRDEVEQLLGRVWEALGLAVARHQPFERSSWALRAACIFLQSSPA